jgi:hypothetical protein
MRVPRKYYTALQDAQGHPQLTLMSTHITTTAERKTKEKHATWLLASAAV